MVRDEVREWLVEFLLAKVREDLYPSPTHLALIEQAIPRRLIPEYIEVLMEKVEQDEYPSIPLLRRILRLSRRLRDYDYDHDHDYDDDDYDRDRSRERETTTGETEPQEEQWEEPPAP